jgi:hypothetical protein
MTTMKESTTCGRREMRALYEARQTNVALPNTRLRVEYPRGPAGKPLVIRPDRKVRDHGNAPWGAHLTAVGQTLPRRMRRALSGVRKLSRMETMVTMEKLLRVKGTR